MERRLIVFFLLMSFLFITACKRNTAYSKYDVQFFGDFDTVINIIVYEKDEKKANDELYKMRSEFDELNKLFDKYNTYNGINNLKTINDNAGVKQVKVDDRLYYLIKRSIENYHDVSDSVNIAMGPVVDLWNSYRELYNSGKTKEEVEKIMGSYLPTDEELNALRPYINMDDIKLNDNQKTIYLEKKGMKLDVGSVAKGYATKLVAENAEKNGVKCAVINAGGNVCLIGNPFDKDKFEVAIENPYEGKKDIFLTILKVGDESVVTSGDYQRFFKVDGKIYSHIIDPKTLRPSENFKSVTIISKDSFLCDYLSTALFILPFDEGIKLCEKENVEAIWALPNGEVKATDGAYKIMEE